MSSLQAVDSDDRTANEPSQNSKLIDGALPDGFALHNPLAVDFWREGTEYVASAPSIGVHAFGQSEDEAVANLRAEIVALYRRLEELGDRLAPRMVTQRDRLRQALAVVYA
jgi:hypothetical protein